MRTISSIHSSSRLDQLTTPARIGVAFVSFALFLTSCAGSDEAQTPISLRLDEVTTTTGDDEPPLSAVPEGPQTEESVLGGESNGGPSSTELTIPAADPAGSSTTSVVDNPLDGTNDLAPPGLRTEWEGLIDGRIGYSLWLAQDDGRVRGEITYDSVGTPITVLGQRYPESADEYFLREYGLDGNISGYLLLSGVVDGQITEAEWGTSAMTIAPTGTSTYNLDPVVRPGEYRYAHEPFGPDDDGERIASDECCGPSGILLLSDISDDSIWVRIETVTSGPAFNLAIVPPTELPLSGNRALFDQTGDFGLDCAFEIVVYDGVAFVDYVDDRFDCQFGNNASVVGQYVLVG